MIWWHFDAGSDVHKTYQHGDPGACTFCWLLFQQSHSWRSFWSIPTWLHRFRNVAHSFSKIVRRSRTSSPKKCGGKWLPWLPPVTPLTPLAGCWAGLLLWLQNGLSIGKALGLHSKVFHCRIVLVLCDQGGAPGWSRVVRWLVQNC